MRSSIKTSTLVIAFLAAAVSIASAQSADPYAALHWRQIGPGRAGRARALDGVPSQPNVFYIGFDNGGLWRSTDYGNNWEPLFDQQSTGSIGAIAVAPSDPNIIYVGSGAGIIRPDLSVGDGMYKSTDGGKTWTHLGLRDSQMIAMIEVDPLDPNRLYVAALGHPYGPNAERGIFRSTDGGQTFQKVLYRDEYTSANDVRIDPSDHNTLYATLWQQQQSFIEGGAFAGAGGIFKSTDGGSTWKQLAGGLPSLNQANLAIARSNSKIIYATVAPLATPGAAGGFGGPAIGFYKSVDAGEHWFLATQDPGLPPVTTARVVDQRPLARIGGGDLPTIVVDPKNEKVVYSASTVFWRTEDGGLTWSAVRGAPGGDDYQKAWINPNNPDLILAVSDQGAVVSGNRGVSWSNWYNQPTAAMYHVSTDNAFPYRVCGGQQDSGSACVESRSMDGQITFRDWHPVNIQEYGVAASDPRDPDKVFGSQRSGVSLFDRKTHQTTLVGPDMTAVGPNGERYNRNVRTMPINWSPLDANVLYYASNAVWKTMDRGHSWARISPDLARQTWAVPANAGNYASSVKPGPMGSITALSPSPKSAKVMWAGTDDGNIQMTADGGAKWWNVTPPEIKPWTRIFNIEAGHFDTQTAYVAANTFRLDDLNPHFYRTHDGGKSWQAINTGIAAGAVANSIREDPRKKGLLYAATETQVWVSFDDGDHWQSLRLDMPAISVRDLQVKDDSACLCSDLIAATHGRGFYILDNLTPFRQAAEAKAASGAYLFKPATALRVRIATIDPTPLPPEVPAGENPLPGGVIDYQLAADASGPVTIHILDAAGKVVRSYSSDDPRVSPDPAVNPAGYNSVCQTTPNATFCGLPLYWPAPAMTVSTKAGLHRFTWDLHFNPVTAEAVDDAGDVEATGAVPHHTYPAVNAPWAPPGTYTVRLTVDGKSYTQPLRLRLDPRVKTPAAGLAQLASLSREMYDAALATHAAQLQARALATKLGALTSPDAAAFKAQVDSVAPAPQRGGGPFARFLRRRGGAAAAPTLESVTNSLVAAAMAMQGADVTPTATQVAACKLASAHSFATLGRWNTLKTSGLAALNTKLKAAGQATVPLSEEDR